VDLEATPSHQDAIKHNLQPGDPRWLTPELVTPDRLLFLDGTLQVRFIARLRFIFISLLYCVFHICRLFLFLANAGND
jgi:hypothetical protein